MPTQEIVLVVANAALVVLEYAWINGQCLPIGGGVW